MSKLRFLTYLFMIVSAFLITACPPYPEGIYFVYYDPNEATSGREPEDSNAYQTGEKAVVLDPGDLQKEDFDFEGWRQYDSRHIYKPGDTITIDYGNIYLYAVWKLIGNAFKYVIVSEEITITGYKGFSWEELITVPATIESKPVTCIGDEAFTGLYMSQVILPEGLTAIGSNAFSHNYLSGMIIPDRVTSIGSIAFQSNRLMTLYLGDNLVSIGDYAFDDNSLTHLAIPGKVNCIGAGAFNRNSIDLVKIGSDVTIKNDSSLGTYGASFRQYYNENGKKGGVYVYHGDSWKLDTSF